MTLLSRLIKKEKNLKLISFNILICFFTHVMVVVVSWKLVSTHQNPVSYHQWQYSENWDLYFIGDFHICTVMWCTDCTMYTGVGGSECYHKLVTHDTLAHIVLWSRDRSWPGDSVCWGAGPGGAAGQYWSISSSNIRES